MDIECLVQKDLGTGNDTGHQHHGKVSTAEFERTYRNDVGDYCDGETEEMDG